MHDRDNGTGGSRASFPLLELPFELRLEIYELLLCSPDYIIISSGRRQIYWYRPQLPAFELRRLPHRMPHVELLRTCKQVNAEATHVLYGRNRFLVALPFLTPFYPSTFFLWNLRRSTVSNVTSIAFTNACSGNCPEWLVMYPVGKKKVLCVKEWTTTGPQLAKLCFPHYSQPHSLPLTNRIWDAYTFICEKISQDKTGRLFGYTCGKHKGTSVNRSGRKKELAPMRF
ncbi:hypothetical protein F5Y11DRAFT_200375 [Daldinia sp. FL1419]|nr:hypothetical protein F5Y11DRAFT_200375 [Daldinia sp. FL1419]